MKLRLQGSTLRLRLRRSEIENLMNSGQVQDTVQFSNGGMIYSLVLDDSVGTPNAEFRGHEISVRLPRDLGLSWCRGTETAILSDRVTPTVLIERDFVRTAVEEPDDYDRFTTPRAGRKPPPPPRVGRVD